MLGRARAAADRGDLVRAPRRDPAARRRRGGARRVSSGATGVAYSVLIPNERGLEHALAHRDRFDEVNLFLSASETHNRKNVNRSIEESLRGPRAGDRDARASEGLRCEGVISVSLRLSLRGRGPARARLRDRRAPRRAPAARRSPSATRPGWRTRARSASSSPPRASGSAERRADRPLPQHPRPGPRERARRAGAGGRLVRVGVRRARRLPGAAGLDREHLDRGPGLDAGGDGGRDRASTWRG